MPTEISIEDALRCAVNTAIEQPSEVPEAPSGWIELTLAALASHDQEKISECADTIRLAHSNYRADGDVKEWLYDLRNAAREARLREAEQNVSSRTPD